MNSDDVERDPIARELRASLARHAAQAPAGDMLAERIIHAADQETAARRHRRSFRRWSLPLIAAGAVGAVVATVVAIENYHPNHDESAALTSSSATATPSRSATESPTSGSSTATPGPSPTSEPITDLQQVHVLDLTFVGPSKGWALASAKCVNGSGRCTALLHTTDGQRWPSVRNPQFGFRVKGVEGCREPCVQGIRFADSEIGYAYGPNALFMTTDGGVTWSQQSGGAIALESANLDVIRVSASGGNLKVATAPNGSTHWQERSLPGSPSAASNVQLTRSNGSDAYLAVGEQLYRTTDNGASWQAIDSPCPQGLQSVSAGGGARVAMLCRDTGAPRSYVMTSSDAGSNWHYQRTNVPTGTTRLLTGDPKTVLVTADEGLAYSTDSGRSWTPVPDVFGPFGFVGFENAEVGRALTADGKSLWTTSDGGRHWLSTVFP